MVYSGKDCDAVYVGGNEDSSAGGVYVSVDGLDAARCSVW